MDGEIAALSGGVGAGSTFTFSVKLAPAGAVPKTVDPTPLGGKRVRIADSSAATRRTLVRQARAWGMVAEEAASARGSIEALRAPAPAALDAAPAAGSALRILVAEDNPTNQRIVVQLLQRLGYGADLAANGVEALHAVQQRRYDVVLMDMMMPEMDGLAATRSIRETRPADEQPHIIAVTANVAAEARQQCFQAGMDDYLSKPVSVASLRAALERAVSPRRPPLERNGVAEVPARS
jgi:CheY-like chemotaxis protein